MLVWLLTARSLDATRSAPTWFSAWNSIWSKNLRQLDTFGWCRGTNLRRDQRYNLWKSQTTAPPCIQRAISKIWKPARYDLMHRNCEHFTTWCCTGMNVSKQSDAAFKLWAPDLHRALLQNVDKEFVTLPEVSPWEKWDAYKRSAVLMRWVMWKKHYRHCRTAYAESAYSTMSKIANSTAKMIGVDTGAVVWRARAEASDCQTIQSWLHQLWQLVHTSVSPDMSHLHHFIWAREICGYVSDVSEWAALNAWSTADKELYYSGTSLG